MEALIIPKERVDVLVGKGGECKKRLETLTGTEIFVNTDGEVTVSGETTSGFFLREVITAIGRGFSPADAEHLLNENYMLDMIDLREVASGENNISRIKGRIIGDEGKMKTEIENATDCRVSVYGSTVGIISRVDTMQYARKAIIRIIDGAQLPSVFNDLARFKKEILANRLLGR
jgi:ribosomal RNA assembly protein